MYFTREDCKKARQMGVRACVFLGIEPADYAPTIVVPVREAGRLLGTHFLARHDRQIASVAPIMPEQTSYDAWLGYTEGLQSVLDQAGVQLTRLPMAPTLDSARAAVDQLLSSPRRPTAVVGFTATYSLVLLKALLERNVPVPQDIAVASMEDTFICNLVHPALTSISFDLETVGAHQVEIAHALIRGEEPDAELFVCPPPELIVRDST
jgi:DNA-binding LacI/PurR family transcriptional regulator